jgi:hypothetical protein
MGRAAPHSRGQSRLARATTTQVRLSALRPPLAWVGREGIKTNPDAATRRGNEETALFDIVKMKRREWRIGNGALEHNRVGGNALESRPSARRIAPGSRCFPVHHIFGTTAAGGLLKRCPLKDRIQSASRARSCGWV